MLAVVLVLEVVVFCRAALPLFLPYAVVWRPALGVRRDTAVALVRFVPPVLTEGACTFLLVGLVARLVRVLFLITNNGLL